MFLRGGKQARGDGNQAGRVHPALLLSLVCVLLLGARIVTTGRVLLSAGEAGSTPELAVPPRREPAAEALLSLALFRDSVAAPAMTAELANLPAPADPGLGLRLEGVMLAAAPAASVAIIGTAARQGSYRVGDALPGAGQARLESIHQDFVIINRAGRRETLRLFTDGGSQGAPAPVPANTPAPAGEMAQPFAPAVAARIGGTLADILTVAPAQENGRLIGYRLTPGPRLKEFVQLGFRTNDVVTGVNGIALNDMANLPQLYSLMNGATEVSFSLLREGRPLTLHVALSP